MGGEAVYVCVGSTFVIVVFLHCISFFQMMKSRQIRKLHRCRICKGRPSLEVARTLSISFEAVTLANGQYWIMCDLCGKFSHFDCLCERFELTVSQKEKDLVMYLQNGVRYICAPCRLVQD